MRTIYLYVDRNGITRKVAVDMPYLASHKKIRLLKFYFEDGLYLVFSKNHMDKNSIDKYYLTKDKIIYEDKDHYFFEFPFKFEQVIDVAV